MSDHSLIEWTDATWNPVTGCTKVSPGCAHCYAERLSHRFRHSPKFAGTVHENGRWTGTIKTHPAVLDEPLRWRKPRTVFTCSMSDLFHAGVEPEFLDRVFAVMALCPQHTFQVLTKRSQRMAEFCSRFNRAMPFEGGTLALLFPPNIWLGVSVENQEFADRRIPHLLRTPAAVRFLSCEPLLGPIDLKGRPRPDMCLHCGGLADEPHLGHTYRTDGLDWVIVGAESGPRARVMELDWARFIVSQCQVASVPVFVKQLCKDGRKIPFEQWPEDLKVREWPKGRVVA